MTAEPGGRCLHCTRPISAAKGFYEITKQPDGHMWCVCSLDCLAALVQGGQS